MVLLVLIYLFGSALRSFWLKSIHLVLHYGTFGSNVSFLLIFRFRIFGDTVRIASLLNATGEGKKQRFSLIRSSGGYSPLIGQKYSHDLNTDLLLT